MIKLSEIQAVTRKVSVVSETVAGIELTADLRIFKQMLSNLLSNAIKFTLLEGKVRIATTGNGVVTAFRKFGQVNGDINRIHAGTGLGLPLVSE